MKKKYQKKRRQTSRSEVSATERDGDVRPIRTIVRRLRRKLGDDVDNSAYIFTEPRVGYRMPEGEG